MSNQTADALGVRLIAASASYYGGGAPILSDAQYDALEDQLRSLDPVHPALTKVGAPADSGWAKVAHPIPMGSLDKAQDDAAFLKWAATYGIVQLLATEKLDGISVLLTYNDGLLERAETRGDGEVGEDITRNVRVMQGVPQRTAWVGMAYVRAEIMCLKSDFAAHFPGESNTRNTASGTAKRQSNWQKAKHLTVIAYNLTLEKHPCGDRAGELADLVSQGFRVPNSRLVTAQSLIALREAYIKGDRAALDYDIDGWVVEINDTDKRESYGTHSLRPRAAVAVKFPHESKASTLRNIVWQVGNSGRITPVAEFDPVELAGAMVSRASLYNVAYVEGLAQDAGVPHLYPGDLIEAARQNDVIPRVASVLSSAGGTPFTTPTSCPTCGYTLEMCKGLTGAEGEYLMCYGPDCGARVIGMILRWVEKVNILHLGEALVRALVEAGVISDIAGLYGLDETELANFEIDGRRFGGNAKRVIASLNNSRTMPVDLFVGSLGINLVGRKMVSLLVDAGYDDLNKLASVTEAEMASVPGFGAGRAAAFRAGFEERKPLMLHILASGVQIIKPVKVAATGSSMTGQAVCMTNFRDADMAAKIVAEGGRIASGVSRNTTLLVNGKPAKTTGKVKNALDLGVEILTVDEMWTRLGGRS